MSAIDQVLTGYGWQIGDLEQARAELVQLRAGCNAAIAAAVQAEREACAKEASKAIMKINTGTQAARDMTMAELRAVCADKAQVAIRARNGAGRK